MKLPSSEVLGLSIARFRRMHNWSQRELAKKLDAHQTMVARWESGQSIPKEDTLKKLAEVLEISIAELLEEPGSDQLDDVRVSSDPELNRLLAQIDSFDPRDRDALKAFLEAIVTKNRVRAALQAS